MIKEKERKGNEKRYTNSSKERISFSFFLGNRFTRRFGQYLGERRDKFWQSHIICLPKSKGNKKTKKKKKKGKEE